MINELREVKESQMGEPIKEVQKLLTYDSIEDNKIIDNAFSNSQIATAKDIMGAKIDLEKLEAHYGEVFTLDQIKQLALNYKLRFLSSTLYSNNFDVEVISKMKEFSKDTNVNLDHWTLKSKFFILAPGEMFALNKKKYVTRAELRAQLDPVMFYKIDEHHYRMIHKWGKDFTVFRRILGYKWRNATNHYWFNFMMAMPVLAIIFSVLFPIFTGLHYVGVLIISSIVASMYALLSRKTDELKPIKDFYTETNWNSSDKIHK